MPHPRAAVIKITSVSCPPMFGGPVSAHVLVDYDYAAGDRLMTLWSHVYATNAAAIPNTPPVGAPQQPAGNNSSGEYTTDVLLDNNHGYAVAWVQVQRMDGTIYWSHCAYYSFSC